MLMCWSGGMGVCNLVIYAMYVEWQCVEFLRQSMLTSGVIAWLLCRVVRVDVDLVF
jgi:hypothetical protein